MHSSPEFPETIDPCSEALPFGAPNEPRNSPPAVPPGAVLPVTVDDEMVIAPSVWNTPPPFQNSMAPVVTVLSATTTWSSVRCPLLSTPPAMSNP